MCYGFFWNSVRSYLEHNLPREDHTLGDYFLRNFRLYHINPLDCTSGYEQNLECRPPSLLEQETSSGRKTLSYNLCDKIILYHIMIETQIV